MLGHVYFESVLGKKNPKVGLVNIGSEEEKGSIMVKEAYQLLKNSDLNFVGNVEARDIPTTDVDILVCDGFTGNIVLKLLEGLSSYLMKGIKKSIMGSAKGKIGGALIKNDLKQFKKQFDSDEAGGAPFLGVKGGIIKAHGSSGAYAIKNAINQSIKFIDNDVLGKITAKLQEEKAEKFAKVQEIIAEQLELDPAKITMESSLMEDLEADSLDVIELVMAFEEEFGVKMPDEELENIKTVGDIVNALN